MYMKITWKIAAGWCYVRGMSHGLTRMWVCVMVLRVDLKGERCGKGVLMILLLLLSP